MALEINDQNFSTIINQNKIVVIDFWAPWCGPCRAIAPMIDQLSNEFNGRALVCKMNVDANQITAAQFGIKNIPALLFFKNGQLADKMGAGAYKSAIEAKINSLL